MRKRSTSRVVSSGGTPAAGVGYWVGGVSAPCSSTIWFTSARCTFIVERIWVKKSAVSVHSTSVLNDGSMPRLSAFRIGGMPWRMFISIGTASETCAPRSFTFCQPKSDIPVMWMNRLSGPMPMWPLPPTPAASLSKIGRMPNGDRMCAAICSPSWRPIVHDRSVLASPR